jgi:hypothetical protein
MVLMLNESDYRHTSAKKANIYNLLQIILYSTGIVIIAKHLLNKTTNKPNE